MKSALIQKYGRPKSDRKVFVKPYYEGDGYHEQAIRLGKAFYVAEWPELQGDDGANGLGIFIPDTLMPMIEYTSAAWPEEAKRRKAKANRAL